ncbi:MAG TPA: ribosome maturation factor RimM [Pseudolabrys sp.]|nr:ribosome maturation factor RimM [Pseudolabrys sp.]
MADRICVARIGAAHGVRGEVKLWSFTENPAAVADYGPLETADGARKFEIETLRPAKDHFVARLAGIGDCNAAEALCNVDLYVPRERLPAIEDADTFYHSDLIGLDAVTPDGSQVGTVHAVHNFGAGDIIEITPPGGGEPMMLPFNETAVPKVDLAAKQIVIVLPAVTSIPPLKGEGRPPKQSEGDEDSSPPRLRGRSAPKAPGGG